MIVYTFGDSILDCGHYNAHGVSPGGLVVRNDDRLFPEFAGRDLASKGPARLEHLAVDGSTVDDLKGQVEMVTVPKDEPSLAMVTIGGNDLIRGLLVDTGPGVAAFAGALRKFLAGLSVGRIYVGNVYDPTFGDDARNFTGLPSPLARAAHRRVNEAIGEVAARHGVLVDLHAHFLKGDPSWMVNVIEPSLVGASEVRRCFWEAMEEEGR